MCLGDVFVRSHTQTDGDGGALMVTCERTINLRARERTTCVSLNVRANRSANGGLRFRSHSIL